MHTLYTPSDTHTCVCIPLTNPTQTKQRVLTILSDLERAAPFRPGAPGASESLLGEWSLVFASDGTVVTRTAPAQLLAQMASLPGVGLMDIQQELDNPAAGARAGAARAGFFWGGMPCAGWRPQEACLTWLVGGLTGLPGQPWPRASTVGLASSRAGVGVAGIH